MAINNREEQSDVYDPEAYWSWRAETAGADMYQAVCLYNRPPIYSIAAENTQLNALTQIGNHLNFRGAHVMELGCGVGRLAAWFVAQGADYTGTDISAPMIDMARQRVPQGTYHKLDSHELPFPDNNFDLVYSVTVLHHNPHANQEAMIAEMIRVTKPGGLVYILEGCHRKTERTTAIMFPRAFDEWIDLFMRQGNVRLVYARPIRWLLLRDIVRFVPRLLYRMLFPSTREARETSGTPAARRVSLPVVIILRLGGWIDPLLMRFLPRRFATNIALLVRKEQPSDHAVGKHHAQE